MTNQVKMTETEVDDFLNELIGDQSKPKSKLNKLTMTARDNKGTVMFVIIPEGTTGRFYRKLERVREVNQFTDLNDKIEGDCWHKILPKDAYGELSPEDSMLYDQCVKLYDKLYDSGAWGWDQDRAGVARYRTYGLFYGYILKHINEQGTPVKDQSGNLTAGKPTFMMYPTNKVIDSLATAIDTKKMASNGNVAWVPRYLSRAAVGRTGAINIKTTGGKGGYTITTSFESNSEDNPNLVPLDLDLTEAFGMCQDAIKDFLGWQCGKEGYFNRDLFLEIREYLTGYFLPDGDTINPQFLEDGGSETEETAPADPLA